MRLCSAGKMGIMKGVSTKAKPAATLLAVCVARSGGKLRASWHGLKVCEYVIEWAIVAHELERMPTTEEYREWWAISERSAWRHRAAIRELFPGDEFPRLVEGVAAQMTARLAAGSRRRLYDLPVRVAA